MDMLNMWRNMKNKTIILLTIPVIAITMTSCGTIAGVGKDIQSVGRTMERSEHKRMLGTRSTPVPRTVYTQPAPPIQPGYPTYPTHVTR